MVKESGNAIHDFSLQNCGGSKEQESPFTTSYLKNFGGPKWRKQETPFARSRFKVFDAQSEGNRTLNSLFWYFFPHAKSPSLAHDFAGLRPWFVIEKEWFLIETELQSLLIHFNTVILLTCISTGFSKRFKSAFIFRFVESIHKAYSGKIVTVIEKCKSPGQGQPWKRARLCKKKASPEQKSSSNGKQKTKYLKFPRWVSRLSCVEKYNTSCAEKCNTNCLYFSTQNWVKILKPVGSSVQCWNKQFVLNLFNNPSSG